MAYRNSIEFGSVEISLVGRASDAGVIEIEVIDGDQGCVDIEMRHIDLVRLATVILDAAAEINPERRRVNGAV